MGSSFVLFDVSMEITQGQFRFGESGYTQKRPCPWANAIYPWVKGPVKPRLMSASQSSDLLLSLTLLFTFQMPSSTRSASISCKNNHKGSEKCKYQSKFSDVFL